MFKVVLLYFCLYAILVRRSCSSHLGQEHQAKPTYSAPGLHGIHGLCLRKRVVLQPLKTRTTSIEQSRTQGNTEQDWFSNSLAILLTKLWSNFYLLRLEAIATRVEAIAIRLEAIAIQVAPIRSRLSSLLRCVIGSRLVELQARGLPQKQHGPTGQSK